MPTGVNDMLHDTKLTLKAAQECAGKLSISNSKMPGSTFTLSASRCNVGSKLAEVEGSVCHRCYAMKLQRLRPSVDKGWTSNTDKANAAIAGDVKGWVRSMVYQINHAAKKTGQPYHRWFDSGDLQSVQMLEAIVMVARKTPHIKHWLPTREAKMVKSFLGKHKEGFPSNLVVRISATMVGDKPVRSASNTSTVHRKGSSHFGYECPASKQDGNCGECRACWAPEVHNVSYPLH
jgi:hypothetical protein